MDDGATDALELAFEEGALRWILDGTGQVLRANRTAMGAIEGNGDAGVLPDEANEEGAVSVDGPQGEDRGEDGPQGEGRREDGSSEEEPAWHGTLWEGPWWTAGDEQELAAAVDGASPGEPARVETTAQVEPDRRAPVDVTIRAASADRLLATAVDVSERVELAAELQRSEELHRVVLNNMTDTILLTDDEGRFTYICPNVHFIFGYTVEEIEAMGTIEELLGEDLYDPADLAREGVLTNIECETADKAGEDHTLLVNVKRVSIQEGTILYSCRDITTRKQRERALSALHHTARELSYAETDEEIARIVVEDASEMLPTGAVACYLYDAAENLLRPVAASDPMRREYGPLHPLRPGEGGPGEAFLEGDVLEDARVGSEVDGGPVSCLTMGDHGVFVVGTTGAVDPITREVAELVAGTAEAALDRLEREATLRERDRQLSEQNRRLERASRINDLIREVDRAIVRADSREAIESAVCERLVAADRFAFAWIGEHAAGRTVVRPRTWAGEDRGYLDRVTSEGIDPDEPAVRAASTEQPCTVTNVGAAPRAAPWRKLALSSGFQSVVSVPLVADEAHHGTLSVYATRPDAFDEVTRSVLAELGHTVGSAISAVARKEALLGDARTRLHYEGGRPDDLLGRLAGSFDCAIGLEGTISTDEGITSFLTVEGADPAAVLAAVLEQPRVRDGRVVTTEGGGDDDAADGGDGDAADGEDGDAADGGDGDAADAGDDDAADGGDGDAVDGGRTDAADGGADERDAEGTGRPVGGLLQVRRSRPDLVQSLADHGASIVDLSVTPEGMSLVVDVPRPVATRTIDEIVVEQYPGVELIEQHSEVSPPGRRESPLEVLTDRQREVVQTAYYAGYFERPRRSDGEDVARALEISPQAVYQHIRAAQGALLEAAFSRG